MVELPKAFEAIAAASSVPNSVRMMLFILLSLVEPIEDQEAGPTIFIDATMDEVAGRLGVNPRQARKLAKKAEDKGLLVRKETGGFVLIPPVKKRPTAESMGLIEVFEQLHRDNAHHFPKGQEDAA